MIQGVGNGIRFGILVEDFGTGPFEEGRDSPDEGRSVRLEFLEQQVEFVFRKMDRPKGAAKKQGRSPPVDDPSEDRVKSADKWVVVCDSSLHVLFGTRSHEIEPAAEKGRGILRTPMTGEPKGKGDEPVPEGADDPGGREAECEKGKPGGADDLGDEKGEVELMRFRIAGAEVGEEGDRTHEGERENPPERPGRGGDSPAESQPVGELREDSSRFAGINQEGDSDEEKDDRPGPGYFRVQHVMTIRS